MTLYLMVGPSGSGKSTYAIELAKEVNGDYLSSDSVRLKLFGDESNQDNNSLVFLYLYNALALSLASGRDAILDTTALTPQVRQEAIKIARRFNAKIVAVCFKISIETAKERNRSRDRQVPEYVIESQYRILSYPTLAEVDELRTIEC